MCDIFKYQWIKGDLAEWIQNEIITSSFLEENALIYGTSSGHILVFTLAGRLIKKYKAHEGKVNAISVDNNGSIILSCSVNGTVTSCSMKSEGEEKEVILTSQSPLTAICVEDSLSTKKERSFVVGTLSGQLIYHRHTWFTKDIELFRGSSSPITAIAWRGDVVAWADAGQVRVMNITTQAAVCYLNSPPNVGPQNPFPCKLFWESEYDLLVGWADSFRHLQLVHTTISRTNQESQNGSAGVYIRARLIADWRADTIICGVSPFDQEHVLILGYLPPDDNVGDLSIDGTDHQQRVDGPELLLMRRKDGLLKSADMLPVKSNDQMESLFTSPEQFHLLSNYSCYSRRTDYLKWNLDLPYDRGGYRGLPPHVYLLTPNGTIVSRVRDVNDRITAALQQNNLQLAADLAKAEKHTLRIYQYHDLVKAYVNSLLHEDQAELAAKECQRLIENDIENIPIWEHWINEFASRKRLTYIAPYVPVENPRLSNSIYEVILSNFLLVNSQAFLSAVRKWGIIRPPLFDWKVLLDRVRGHIDTRKRSLLDADPWLLESKAYLHTLLQQYDKALETYLEIEPNELRKVHSTDMRDDSFDEQATGDKAQNTKNHNFQYVFDLIEKQDLFDVISDKILRLVRLSPKQAESLLVRNIEKVPVYLVVKQLKDETELLHWYLHSLVTNAPELYNTQEYAEFHLMQVSLYAHFAPKTISTKTNKSVADQSLATFRDPNEPLISSSFLESLNSFDEETNFLKFLKFSNFVPLEVALRECDRQSPPLYREKIYILAKMGNAREGLSILLREVGDVKMAIHYLEQYNLNLWEDVVDHALAHHDFLGELLDLIGLFNKFNPLVLVKKLPPCMEIPLLRQRLLQLIRHCDFQAFVREQCRLIQQDDTLSLLTQLNHSQRKGMRINRSTSRCAGCGRPTSMPSIYSPSSTTASADGSLSISTPLPIWGLPGGSTGGKSSNSPAVHHTLHLNMSASNYVVFLPNKIAYHLLCFEKTTAAASVSTSTSSSSHSKPHSQL